MSNFPSLPKRGHRPLMGKRARVVLNTSVDPETLASIDAFAAHAQVSRGVLIDRLIAGGKLHRQNKAGGRLSQRTPSNQP